MASSLKLKGQGIIDIFFPPEKRAELIAKVQAFAISNPKLSAFLLTNFALTGLPLIMFVVFSITVFIFSLVAALLIALLAALLFTAFMVGTALLIVLPTVFLTTMAATFLFLWGLGGYYILKWFNEGESPASEGLAIGDKLNSLTGGRIGFLMDGARKQQEKGKDERKASETNGLTEKSGVSNVSKNIGAGNVADYATKAADVHGVNKRAGGATSTVKNAAGSAKGAVSGLTGLS